MRESLRRESAAVGAMVAATLLWGATFVVIRDSVRALDPRALVFARFSVAAVVLGGAAWLRGGRVTRAELAGGLLAGLFMAGGYAFQAIGLVTASAGSSAFLTCAGTLFAGFFAWPLLGQRPTAVLVGGIALALAGSALLSLGAAWSLGAGELWTLLGAMSFALQICAISRVAASADPVRLAALQSLAVALALSPAAGTAARQFAALDGAGWARFGYLAVAGSVIAPLLQLLAQRAIPAGRIGLLFALEPVFALLFAVTLGAERFAARWWLGAALILAAVLAVEARSSREPASSPTATG